MKVSINEMDVQERLKKWSQITALSLDLLEASIRRKHPDLSKSDLRQKVIDRLNLFRKAKYQ